jgi:hypothetical protein
VQERVIKKRGLTGKQLARAKKAVDNQIFARAQAERALYGAEAVHLAACVDLEQNCCRYARGEARVHEASSAEAQNLRTHALGVGAMLIFLYAS